MTPEEQPQKERKPVTGERAFQDTDEAKHRKIVEYVNARKKAYFDSPDYKAYIARVNSAKLLVNQDTRNLDTRFKMRFGLMRAGYDNLVDSFDDLFDVDDLIICRPDGKNTEQLAQDWQLYSNRLLRSIRYNDHLSDRFLYIPDYGWSVAHDSYRLNQGWQVKAQSKVSAIPNFEDFEFGMEMDTLMDQPLPEIVRPDQWFGSVTSAREQPFQGTIKRWYLRDVYAAMEMKDAKGNNLYNVQALQKLCDLMSKGHQDADEYARIREEMGELGKDVDKGEKDRGPFVDVIRFYGPLNEISDSELAKDPNEYYVECTRSVLLRWQENPRDRYTPFTHARSHRYRNNPFSRSYLDAMLPHQQFNDLLVCMGSESLVDNLSKHWAYWPEDMIDPDDFTNPKGLNAFIELQGLGRLPQVVQAQRSGAFTDIKDLLVLFDRDRQRVGATDQEMGVQGGTQDKTATAARLLASATSKKVRSMIKRISRDAVLPQVRNLVMLSLVHGNPERRKFLAGDREVRLTGEHLKWWMQAWVTESQIMINDTITRDRNEEAMKATTFFQYAQQMVGANMIPPDSAVHILRYSAELSGIPQDIIDKALPPPLPVTTTTPDGKEVVLPSSAGLPPPPMPQQMPIGPAAPVPMQGENANASMAAPIIG
jgi:hypothetical protein